MAARVEAKRDEQPAVGGGQQQTQQAAPAGASETHEVSLTAFRVQFPGLVSMTSG